MHVEALITLKISDIFQMLLSLSLSTAKFSNIDIFRRDEWKTCCSVAQSM